MAFCKHRIMDNCRKYNRPCIFSDECFEPEEIKPKTNAEHIRAMSDEELAMCLYEIGYDGGWFTPKGTLEWLQQPPKEG